MGQTYNNNEIIQNNTAGGFYAQPQPSWGGYQPNQMAGVVPSNVASTTTIMTQKEIEELNSINGASLNITKADFLTRMCDHKDGDKFIAIGNPETGEYYCPRCKQTFRVVNNQELDLKKARETLLQAFENMKIMGGPKDLLREIAETITVIDKMFNPAFEISNSQWNQFLKAFRQYSGIPNMAYNGGYGYAYNNNANPSDILMGVRSNGYVPPAYQPQPQVPAAYNNGGYGYVQQPMPQYAQQPQYPNGYQPIPQQVSNVNPNPFDNGGMTMPVAQYQPMPSPQAPTISGFISPNGAVTYNPNFVDSNNNQNQAVAAPANAAVNNITNNPTIPQAPVVESSAPQMAPPVNSNNG